VSKNIITELENFGMISCESLKTLEDIKPKSAGISMAKFYIAFDTMKNVVVQG
jgi:hypothetical protein